MSLGSGSGGDVSPTEKETRCVLCVFLGFVFVFFVFLLLFFFCFFVSAGLFVLFLGDFGGFSS